MKIQRSEQRKRKRKPIDEAYRRKKCNYLLQTLDKKKRAKYAAKKKKPAIEEPIIDFIDLTEE